MGIKPQTAPGNRTLHRLSGGIPFKIFAVSIINIAYHQLHFKCYILVVETELLGLIMTVTRHVILNCRQKMLIWDINALSLLYIKNLLCKSLHMVILCSLHLAFSWRTKITNAWNYFVRIFIHISELN